MQDRTGSDYFLRLLVDEEASTPTFVLYEPLHSYEKNNRIKGTRMQKTEILLKCMYVNDVSRGI